MCALILREVGQKEGVTSPRGQKRALKTSRRVCFENCCCLTQLPGACYDMAVPVGPAAHPRPFPPPVTPCTTPQQHTTAPHRSQIEQI